MVFGATKIIPDNNTLNIVEMEESRLYQRQSQGLIKSIIFGNVANTIQRRFSESKESRYETNRKNNESTDSDDGDDDADENEEDDIFEVEREVNLSSNLLTMLGINHENDKSDNKSYSSYYANEAWKPPSKHGLSNSSPIISNRFYPVRSDSRASINYSDTGRRSMTNLQMPSESKYKDDEEEEEDDDDDDYDYDADEDIDYDNYQLPSTVAMSASLMKALGMDISNVDTTSDWKPPEFTGIGNSERIIK